VKPYKLNEMIDKNSPSQEFRDKYINDNRVKKWIDLALRIEGTNKTYGVHAAGVVIASDPLDELVPLQRNNEGQIITQYSMDDIESLGLLKMDFLGLKNLTMIEKTVSLINQSTGKKINIDELPQNDRKTFELIGRGDLEGIFQLESSGMKQVVKDFKPNSLEDISSILALYRPGPLDAGLIPKFINRKNGNEKVDFPHPFIKSILTETYGIMVYQEQIMKIAQDLAGYSLGDADLLRRAMGKKKVSEMVKHRNIFVDGSMKKGVNEKLANDLFDQMVLFAEYCFNKSHSTAYGAVTYQTAFLKAHFPVAYMAALLSVNSGSSDKMQRYISNCYSMGIEVISPSINFSGVDFTIKNSQILFGLSAIKNLGDSAIKNIYSMIIGAGQWHNTSSALFRKSIDEMKYLSNYFKGKKETVYGLAGLGDLYVSAMGGRNSKMGEYLGKGYTFTQAKKKFMKNDTVEGADLAIEIAPFVFKKINKRKVPLMISLLEAIVKNKKLKIKY